MISNITPFIIFTILYFFIAYFDILPIAIRKSQRPHILMVLWILCAIFAGCRDSYYSLEAAGIFDYGAYKHVYENPIDIFNLPYSYLISDNYVRSMDIGYVMLSSLSSNYIISSPNVFFLIINIISILLLYCSFKRNNITGILFLVLFIYVARLYFQYNFIMMRQGLAMAIVWWSIKYVYDRNLLKFLLLCIVASLFHFSAIFAITIWWFVRTPFKSKTIILIYTTMVILNFIGIIPIFVDSLMRILPALLGFGERFEFYITADAYKRGLNLLNFVEILPFLYLALKYRFQICKDLVGNIFFNMLIFYVFILLLTVNYSALTRISSYFIYSYFYILSCSWKLLSWRNKSIFGTILSLYFLFYAFRFEYANFYKIKYIPFFLD